jgi:hypothetical protein
MNKNSKFNKTYNAQQSLDVSYLWKHPLNVCNSNFDTGRWKCLWIFDIILGGFPSWGVDTESSIQSRRQFLLGFLPRSNKVLLLVPKKKVPYNLDLSDGRHRLPLHFYIRRVQKIRKLLKKKKNLCVGFRKIVNNVWIEGQTYWSKVRRVWQNRCRIH